MTAQAAGLGEAATRESAPLLALRGSSGTGVPFFAAASARGFPELPGAYRVWASGSETGGTQWGVGDSHSELPLFLANSRRWLDLWGRGFCSFNVVLFLNKHTHTHTTHFCFQTKVFSPFFWRRPLLWSRAPPGYSPWASLGFGPERRPAGCKLALPSPAAPTLPNPQLRSLGED